MYTTIILTILQVIFLEAILSLDNAAVLGALVAPLPDDVPVPWPRALRRVGDQLNRILGHQRSAALMVGLVGAYLGRAIMLALATIVLQQPALRVIGGIYLLFLTIDYLGALGETDAAQAAELQHIRRASFWRIVLTVELVDLAFSLDNVVAVVALSQEYWVVLVGVALGIVLMRFAANIFTHIMTWEPRLEIAGYLLIGAISIQLLLNEFWNIHFVPLQIASLTLTADLQQFALSLLIVVLTIICARWHRLAPLQLLWHPILRACIRIRSVFHWLALPFRTLVHSVKGSIKEPANEG